MYFNRQRDSFIQLFLFQPWNQKGLFKFDFTGATHLLLRYLSLLVPAASRTEQYLTSFTSGALEERNQLFNTQTWLSLRFPNTAPKHWAAEVIRQTDIPCPFHISVLCTLQQSCSHPLLICSCCIQHQHLKYECSQPSKKSNYLDNKTLIHNTCYWNANNNKNEYSDWDADAGFLHQELSPWDTPSPCSPANTSLRRINGTEEINRFNQEANFHFLLCNNHDLYWAEMHLQHGASLTYMGHRHQPRSAGPPAFQPFTVGNWEHLTPHQVSPAWSAC